jgi:hypothetical protein
LVCGDTKKNKKKIENEPENGASGDGERACPPGYVVLKEKNKYGAFCEPKEGFPEQAPAQAEKCQFPGEVGTPPNCTCPEGTDFQGYKGCVKVTVVRLCQVFPRSFTNTEYQTLEHNFLLECVSKYKSKKGGSCTTNTGQGTYADTCCCEYTQ